MKMVQFVGQEENNQNYKRAAMLELRHVLQFTVCANGF